MDIIVCRFGEERCQPASIPSRVAITEFYRIMPDDLPLTDDEVATYQWQMWVSDFGERGQKKLKSAVSGTVGCMGAMEAIKLIAGIGEPLTGRLLRIDLRTMAFRTLQVRRRDDCVVCGCQGSTE